MKLKYKWLFSVRKYEAGTYNTRIYGSTNSDPFHTLGEITHCLFNAITYIDFVKFTPAKQKYYESKNIPIIPWLNKYNKHGKIQLVKKKKI